MSLLHLRAISPPELTAEVVHVLLDEPGAIDLVVLAGTARKPDGDLVQADLARECVPGVLDRLQTLGLTEHGTVSLEVVDTAIGRAVVKAERDAPGEGVDAVIWEELIARTGEDAALTWTFLSFIVLSTVLGAIGVVTDSPIAVVGAMVIGPEFGPLAAMSLGLLRRRFAVIRRAAIALVVGFLAAVAVSAGATALWRAAGLVHKHDLDGHRQTEFIYHPGWFSLITAVVAGAAGMLSLTSGRAAALIGVFISVTTIPAAGYAAVALVLGQYGEAGGSLAQLAINLVGIVAAAYAVLAAQAWSTRRRRAHATVG